MIVPALLGAVILSDATPVSSHIRTESSPSLPWNPSMPAPMPLGSEAAMGIGRMDMVDAAPQMARPLQNRAIPGRMRVITGIIAYADPRQGFAIIGSSVQDTFLARPGQRLPDGSWIREIHPMQVVLEYEGSLETVGMYERRQPSDAVYARIPPLPQQTRWEEVQAQGLTAGNTTPSQARQTDAPPGDPRPSDSRPNDTSANEVRTDDAPPSDAPPKPALPRWAQPEAPLPETQDPAEYFSDYRRRRAESRGQFHRTSDIQTE